MLGEEVQVAKICHEIVPDLLELAPLDQVLQLLLDEDALLVGGTDLCGELWLRKPVPLCGCPVCPTVVSNSGS